MCAEKGHHCCRHRKLHPVCSACRTISPVPVTALAEEMVAVEEGFEVNGGYGEFGEYGEYGENEACVENAVWVLLGMRKFREKIHPMRMKLRGGHERLELRPCRAENCHVEGFLSFG